MNGAAKSLLAEIEAFLLRTGASPTKFGLAAVNDGHLVANLRKGHSVTLKTADKVRAYMASRLAASIPVARTATRGGGGPLPVTSVALTGAPMRQDGTTKRIVLV